MGYCIPIITASITVNSNWGFVAAGSSTVCLGSILALESGIISLFPFDIKMTLVAPEFTAIFLSHAGLYFISSFIATFLVKSIWNENFLLNTLNEELESKTLELDQRNKELIAANQQASMAQRLTTINQMTRTLHHEINNPLTAITMASELLTQFPDSPGTQTKLDAILSSSLKIRDVLQQIERIREPRLREAVGTLLMYNLENSG